MSHQGAVSEHHYKQKEIAVFESTEQKSIWMTSLSQVFIVYVSKLAQN